MDFYNFATKFTCSTLWNSFFRFWFLGSCNIFSIHVWAAKNQSIFSLLMLLMLQIQWCSKTFFYHVILGAFPSICYVRLGRIQVVWMLPKHSSVSKCVPINADKYFLHNFSDNFIHNHQICLMTQNANDIKHFRRKSICYIPFIDQIISVQRPIDIEIVFDAIQLN